VDGWLGDQMALQSLWQSSAPEGARTGWGGRMADLFLDDNGDDSVFTCISLAGNAVMMTGQDAVQFQVDRRGVTKLDSNYRSDSVLAGLTEIMQMTPSGPFPRRTPRLPPEGFHHPSASTARSSQSPKSPPSSPTIASANS
jgi:hypothetical protein